MSPAEELAAIRAEIGPTVIPWDDEGEPLSTLELVKRQRARLWDLHVESRRIRDALRGIGIPWCATEATCEGCGHAETRDLSTLEMVQDVIARMQRLGSERARAYEGLQEVERALRPIIEERCTAVDYQPYEGDTSPSAMALQNATACARWAASVLRALEQA